MHDSMRPSEFSFFYLPASMAPDPPLPHGMGPVRTGRASMYLCVCTSQRPHDREQRLWSTCHPRPARACVHGPRGIKTRLTFATGFHQGWDVCGHATVAATCCCCCEASLLQLHAVMTCQLHAHRGAPAGRCSEQAPRSAACTCSPEQGSVAQAGV